MLADLRETEPLLRRSADVVIDATQPLSRVADLVVESLAKTTGQR